MERFERVRLTNPDKVLYPATGTTKAEVFDYYLSIAEVMLPHIAGLDRDSLQTTATLAAQCVVDVLSGAWPAECVVNPEARGARDWGLGTRV